MPTMDVCSKCKHMHFKSSDPREGHCYMFAKNFKGPCGQYTPIKIKEVK